MPRTPKEIADLYELFASVRKTEEAEILLRDILTPQELEVIAERWKLVQALASGMTQRDVAKTCGVSISKVTRGSHELQYGTGGFRLFLRRLRKPCVITPASSR